MSAATFAIVLSVLMPAEPARRNLADLLLLHPVRGEVAANGLQCRAIRVEGAVVEVCTMRSARARRTGEVHAFVLEFTGNMNSAQEITRWVADGIWGERAVEVWAVNYPGFGASTGPAKLSRIGPAALAAYDELRRVAGERPIFVSGPSMGGMAAIFVASRRDVAGVIVLNPPPLRETILHRHGWWNLWTVATLVATEVPTQLDSIANARRCTAPLCAIVSLEDEVVPASLQRRIFDAYAGAATVIPMPAATHGSHVSPDAHAQRGRWIDRVWSQAVATD